VASLPLLEINALTRLAHVAAASKTLCETST